MSAERDKQMQWEIAKGHLRAMVVADGFKPRPNLPPPHDLERFEKVQRTVENFIQHMEDTGLCE